VKASVPVVGVDGRSGSAGWVLNRHLRGWVEDVRSPCSGEELLGPHQEDG
jgi:hypothetical protein